MEQIYSRTPMLKSDFNKVTPIVKKKIWYVLEEPDSKNQIIICK